MALLLKWGIFWICPSVLPPCVVGGRGGEGGGGGMPSIFLYMAREWQTEHENLKKLMVVVILFHRCSENLRKEGLVLPLVEVNL